MNSAPDRSEPPPPPPVDVAVRTFNSESTLAPCLEAARRFLPIHHLLVIDRCSTDGTARIARAFGARVEPEETGIGFATQRAIELADTETILFLDSDVIVRDPTFYARACAALGRAGVGAVVGNSLGHRFAYGLPLGLTLLPRRWAGSVSIPPTAQGSETYFFRRALRQERLRVAYLPDAMIHRSPYRGGTWPEWQGAQIRRAAGGDARELAYTLLVPWLIHANSGSLRNLLYSPIFDAKLLRGYLHPTRWLTRDRRQLPPRENPSP